LYLDGCPGRERVLATVRELADQVGAEVVQRRIETAEAAEAERFLGSPTVRVNGRDVDPRAVERSDYGLKCRIYRSQQLGQSLVPPQQWIRDALEAARD
jgi:hypothetical protein